MTISKEVSIMKKAFNTSIDAEILDQFKEKCKAEKLPSIGTIYARLY